MDIVVCIKQVPDTSEVKLDPVTHTIMREGVPHIINPDDKAGIEIALRLREKYGGKVTLLTMGPPQADIALREGLAMGADEGILLSDRAFAGSDTWATSSVLAAALKKIQFDIIIAGRQATDGDTGQVGSQIAEHLNIPQVSYAEDISLEDKIFVMKQQFEDRYQVVEVANPCLVTVLSEAIQPRYMTIGGAFDAYRGKEVKEWTLKEIKDSVDLNDLGLKGSLTQVRELFTKESNSSNGRILRNLTEDEAVKEIVKKLQEECLI